MARITGRCRQPARTGAGQHLDSTFSHTRFCAARARPRDPMTWPQLHSLRLRSRHEQGLYSTWTAPLATSPLTKARPISDEELAAGTGPGQGADSTFSHAIFSSLSAAAEARHHPLACRQQGAQQPAGTGSVQGLDRGFSHERFFVHVGGRHHQTAVGAGFRCPAAGSSPR
jgi:hypothetical protein